MEIISDALVYPINNIKALIIYVVLGIIAGLAAGGTIIGLIGGANYNNALAGGLGFIGLILTVIIIENQERIAAFILHLPANNCIGHGKTKNTSDFGCCLRGNSHFSEV